MPTSRTQSRRHAPTAKARTPAEQSLLALHRLLFPERYDDGREVRCWTADTLEEVADAIEDSARTQQIPGFRLTEHQLTNAPSPGSGAVGADTGLPLLPLVSPSRRISALLAIGAHGERVAAHRGAQR